MANSTQLQVSPLQKWEGITEISSTPTITTARPLPGELKAKRRVTNSSNQGEPCSYWQFKNMPKIPCTILNVKVLILPTPLWTVIKKRYANRHIYLVMEMTGDFCPKLLGTQAFFLFFDLNTDTTKHLWAGAQSAPRFSEGAFRHWNKSHIIEANPMLKLRHPIEQVFLSYIGASQLLMEVAQPWGHKALRSPFHGWEKISHLPVMRCLLENWIHNFEWSSKPPSLSP